MSTARDRRTIALMKDISAAAANCPMAPPEHASVQARALHRACLIIGGVAELARKLGVSEQQIEQWLRGSERPPESVFLQAVEIVLLHVTQPGGPH